MIVSAYWPDESEAAPAPRSATICTVAPPPGSVPASGAVPPLIVDDELRPVEASEEVSGELCVGGPQTFDGYWQDAEKTAAALFERATPDGPQRYYRTGDRVRPLPNGELIEGPCPRGREVFASEFRDGEIFIAHP